MALDLEQAKRFKAQQEYFGLPQDRADRVLATMLSIGAEVSDPIVTIIFMTEKVALVAEQMPGRMNAAVKKQITDLNKLLADHVAAMTKSMDDQMERLPDVVSGQLVDKTADRIGEGVVKAVDARFKRESIFDKIKMGAIAGWVATCMLASAIGGGVVGWNMHDGTLREFSQEVVDLAKRPDWPFAVRLLTFNDLNAARAACKPEDAQCLLPVFTSRPTATGKGTAITASSPTAWYDRQTPFVQSAIIAFLAGALSLAFGWFKLGRKKSSY